MAHRVVLDLAGTLAQSSPDATVIRAGAPGLGLYLPEGVASWAADAERPVIVDLSELPADEQRAYARSFAEGWTDVGAPGPLLVHELDGDAPSRSWVPAAVGVACLAIAVMPVTAAVVVGTVGGLAAGLLPALQAGRLRIVDALRRN